MLRFQLFFVAILGLIAGASAFAASTCPDDKICVGDRVIYVEYSNWDPETESRLIYLLERTAQSAYTGTVKGVFDNGLSQVAIDPDQSLAFISTSALGKSIACQENESTNHRICVGDRVLFVQGGWGWVGTVKETFNNGISSVALDGNDGNAFIVNSALSKSQ